MGPIDSIWLFSVSPIAMSTQQLASQLVGELRIMHACMQASVFLPTEDSYMQYFKIWLSLNLLSHACQLASQLLHACFKRLYPCMQACLGLHIQLYVIVSVKIPEREMEFSTAIDIIQVHIINLLKNGHLIAIQLQLTTLCGIVEKSNNTLAIQLYGCLHIHLTNFLSGQLSCSSYTMHK